MRFQRHDLIITSLLCQNDTAALFWRNNDIITHESAGMSLSGVPDYFDRNKISSAGDLSHYSSASLY